MDYSAVYIQTDKHVRMTARKLVYCICEYKHSHSYTYTYITACIYMNGLYIVTFRETIQSAYSKLVEMLPSVEHT